MIYLRIGVTKIINTKTLILLAKVARITLTTLILTIKPPSYLVISSSSILEPNTSY